MLKVKKGIIAIFSFLLVLTCFNISEEIVKANDKISFNWTNRKLISKKKKTTKKQKKLKETVQILVKNKFDDEVLDTIFTVEDEIVLKGEINGKGNIKKVVVNYSHKNQKNSVIANGLNEWSAKIPLNDGTNKIEIIAHGDKKITKMIKVNKTNKSMEYNFDSSKFQNLDQSRLGEGIVSYKVNYNETSDKSDDEISLFVKEDSLLMEQVKNGTLKENEVVSMNRSSALPTGFVGTFLRNQSPQSNGDYEAETYPDSDYEELIFGYPSFRQLFKKDISVDFSNGIDSKNPIAFSVLSDNLTTSSSIIVNENKNGKSDILVKLGNIKLNDKISSNSYLTGELSIKDLDILGGLEWYQNQDDQKPEQLLAKIDYKMEGKLRVKGDEENLSEDVIRRLNQKFLENKLQFLGLSSMLPTDLNNKWIVGAIGLNLKTSLIEEADKQYGEVLKPTLVLLLYVDMKGKVTSDTGFQINYSTMSKKGYNIQRKDFVGSFGSSSENLGNKHFDVSESHILDFYDDDKGEFQLLLDKHANSTLSVGAGIYSGLMIGGVSPITVSSDVFYKSDVENIDEGLSADLEKAKINYGVGVQVNTLYNINNSVIQNYIPEWVKIFWEKDPTMARISGKVMNDNKEVLPNIQVNFRDKNGVLRKSVITNENGGYAIDEIKVGAYSIEVVDKNEGKDKYFVEDLSTVIKSGKNKFDILAKLDKPTFVEVRGNIRDSVDGNVVENISLEFKAKNVRGYESGTIVNSTITDTEGNFELKDLPTGIYDVRIYDNSTRTNKYFEESDIFTAGVTEDILFYNYAVSRDIQNEGLRIILLWNSEPNDLDSHIFDPNGNHVFFENPKHGEMMNLDVDKTEGYGPETISLKNMIPGIYSYKVHNYSHSSEIYGNSLSRSKARVVVKRGNVTIKTFEVPKDRVGTVWNVFNYDSVSGQIIDLDSFSLKDDNVIKVSNPYEN